MTRDAMRAMEDAVALERFEASVLAQQPASQPWQPVTDYSFEARKAIEGKHPELIEAAFHPTRVLDFGCGFGHLIALLRERGIDAVGYDPALPARTAMQPCVRPHVTNHSYLIPGGFDLVICREVLEHCTVLEVRRLVPLLCGRSSRFVYVTTRFAKNPTHLLDVDTSDDLDPTHCTMLNQSLLRVLFVLEGFRRRADLEAILDWKQLGRVLVYERA